MLFARPQTPLWRTGPKNKGLAVFPDPNPARTGRARLCGKSAGTARMRQHILPPLRRIPLRKGRDRAACPSRHSGRSVPPPRHFDRAERVEKSGRRRAPGGRKSLRRRRSALRVSPLRPGPVGRASGRNDGWGSRTGSGARPAGKAASAPVAALSAFRRGILGERGQGEGIVQKALPPPVSALSAFRRGIPWGRGIAGKVRRRPGAARGSTVGTNGKCAFRALARADLGDGNRNVKKKSKKQVKFLEPARTLSRRRNGASPRSSGVRRRATSLPGTTPSGSG